MLYTKINSKQKPKCIAKTIKILKENIVVSLHILGFGKLLCQILVWHQKDGKTEEN